MQIVSIGDDLHEMSDPFFWENIISLSSAEFVRRVVKDTVHVDSFADFGCTAGPSCSKLTTSLVNDSLKFQSSDRQIC